MHFATAAVLFACAVSAVAAGSAGDLDWTYHNGAAHGKPSEWGKIMDESTGKPKYPECAGRRQTPINVCGGTPLAGPGPLQLMGYCSTVEFSQSAAGFKWEYKPKSGESCAAKGQDGKVYNLLQFHIHAPSEHTINGKHYDAEVHFVHAAEDGTLLVVAEMLYADGDASNRWLAQAFKHMDADEITTDVHTFTIPPRKRLIPCDCGWYNYEGSLTVPPCYEKVEWWISATPVRISKAQLSLLRKSQAKFPNMDAKGGNNRPIQRINGREVRAYGL